jgi:hypothetical protein
MVFYPDSWLGCKKREHFYRFIECLEFSLNNLGCKQLGFFKKYLLLRFERNYKAKVTNSVHTLL